MVDKNNTGIATVYPAPANPCGRYKIAGRCALLFMICHDEREVIVTYISACGVKAVKQRRMKAK